MVKTYLQWLLISCVGSILTFGVIMDEPGTCFSAERIVVNRTDEFLVFGHANCPEGFNYGRPVNGGKICLKMIKEVIPQNTLYCCEGYYNDSKSCLPYCQQECLHGMCGEPNKCHCDVGFGGTSCEETVNIKNDSIETSGLDIEKYAMMSLIIFLLVLLIGAIVFYCYNKAERIRSVPIDDNTYWSLERDENGNMVPIEKLYFNNLGEAPQSDRLEMGNELNNGELSDSQPIGYIEMCSSDVKLSERVPKDSQIQRNSQQEKFD